MIQIIRAEDGEVFQVNATLRDIERIGSLELFLHQETGVEQEAILAYLSDGQRLRNDNIREFAGSQDQTIFVFNKFYLDYDLDEVLKELRVEAPLQPPVEDTISGTPPVRPSQLASSFLRTALTHYEHITRIQSALRFQHEAVRIASSSLDLNALAISDTFDAIASTAKRELQKQAGLLGGLDADLDLISRVRIHSEFMSPAVRRAIEAGEKQRTLGEYVSAVKMKQVADTCARTHEELQHRFSETEKSMATLTEGSAVVRATVANVSILEGADNCHRRAREIYERIAALCTTLDAPTSGSDKTIDELEDRDAALRREVQMATEAKNAYTEQCIGALRHISTLNSELVALPIALANLQASFRGKNSFSHIQRLHNMLYAYGATVIEVVRRKEFARFFYQRAQNILEIMAKLSADEKKRRQVYRGEVHGQLPFETRGMDDPVPIIDFSPSGNLDEAYSLERSDVDVLIKVLDDLEVYAQNNSNGVALGAVRDTRTQLEKLISKMDSLEAGFDRIVERSLLSASRLSSSRRRFTEADEQAYHQLADQLQHAHQAKADIEASFQEQRDSLQADIRNLRRKLEDSTTAANSERERADRSERDLQHARSQIESETTARRILEQRLGDLTKDVEMQRREHSNALAEATGQTKAAELLRQELAQARADFEEMKALEMRNAAKVANLMEDQTTTLRNLEEARARGEDLEAQIKAARSESDDVNKALKEASTDKDRLLRAQASEHDRIIRDHIAEADGDRAVLEHQFFELKALQADSERRLKDARAHAEVCNADAVCLRDELQRVERELREARQVEQVLRNDLDMGRASQSDYEQRLESSGRLVAQILDVAIAFRDSHVKALNSTAVMTSFSTVTKQPLNLADSAFLSSTRHVMAGLPDEPPPIDPSDPASALEALRAFDHDHFSETIAKPASTIRKWQRQCREYRERAKGKISFRNFSKGDLALFLPTRNSVTKPWAAFNVSAPHYFLQTTGHFAEQLKTREWIVARITSITERVVDRNNPRSNPYNLGEGVKFYILEVEDWTQPAQQTRRRNIITKRSLTNNTPNDDNTSLGSNPPSLGAAPPEAEVEDSFQVTRPPTSHLFPTRPRSESVSTKGRSSLSNLLAQAPTGEEAFISTPVSTTNIPIPPAPASAYLDAIEDELGEDVPKIDIAVTHRPPSPSDPVVPAPPSPTTSIPRHAPSTHSPLRPGSRASSRFSVSRIPHLGATVIPGSGNQGMASKAAPTTALTSRPASISVSQEDVQAVAYQSATPSPEGSISDGLVNVTSHRRRATSFHPHPARLSPLGNTNGSSTSTGSAVPLSPTKLEAGSGKATTGLATSSTLANLASSLGFSIGPKKKAEVANLTAATTTSLPSTNSNDRIPESSASDLLKKF